MGFHVFALSTFLIWLAFAFNEWQKIAYPEECPWPVDSAPYRACFEPLLQQDDTVDLHFYAGTGSVPPSSPVYSSWGRPASQPWEEVLTIPLPPEVRVSVCVCFSLCISLSYTHSS